MLLHSVPSKVTQFGARIALRGRVMTQYHAGNPAMPPVYPLYGVRRAVFSIVLNANITENPDAVADKLFPLFNISRKA